MERMNKVVVRHCEFRRSSLGCDLVLIAQMAGDRSEKSDLKLALKRPSSKENS